MDFIDHCYLVQKKAHQMRRALWSLFVAAIAAYFVWTLGGAPWWAYAILFARSVFELAQTLSDEPARPKATDECSVELPGYAIATVAVAWEETGCLKAD